MDSMTSRGEVEEEVAKTGEQQGLFSTLQLYCLDN